MPDEIGAQIGTDAAVHMQEPDVAFDREGQSFDPAMHEVGKDGKPRLSPAGRLIRKARVAGATGREQGDGPALSPEVRMAGVALASTFFMMTTMLGGEDWKPTNEEREAITVCSAQTLDYYGMQRVHPLVSLGGVLMVYAQPRLVRPEARGAMARLWWRIRHRNAHVDSWHNGLRQDDPREPDLSGLRKDGTSNPDSGPVA